MSINSLKPNIPIFYGILMRPITRIKVRFEIVTVVISVLIFWVVTPCGLVGGYHRFGPEDGDTASFETLPTCEQPVYRHYKT
jgi:hypothetical protein